MNKFNKQPIGVFDTGVGGLTIFKEIRKKFPFENIIYFGDNAHCPYGNKSKFKIINLTKSIVQFLIKERCKIIIVACNTATASSIEYLRQNYEIPFIGMEPAIKPAALNTISGNIGILATKGTFDGELYNSTREKYTNNVNVHISIGEGLVELVESGKMNSQSSIKLLKKYISPMLSKNIDTLVLGCTHYPILKEQIKKITGNKVKLIDSTKAIAERLLSIIPNPETKTKGTDIFYVSGEVKKFKKIGEMIIEHSIKNISKTKLEVK
ncbi:MAG: glutamate racemase [Candidatus Cloacimonetes bacterium]|nr:glutamate racemase [Candidatus Cloacimonadota bacterium]